MAFAEILRSLSPEQPVLIAGPTASGKSALALEIAERQGGVIVNADASQVYACWRVLTARPSPQDEARAPHRLYGHVPATQVYSTGQWLREVTQLLLDDRRLIITGGTGLYFTALTEGLAEIPSTPLELRVRADALSLDALLAGIDADTSERIDRQNRARVQRAWEVQQATGRSLARWQDETGPPTLGLDQVFPIVFDVPRDVLNARITRRFDAMIDAGALDEARAVAPSHDPALPAHRAIGACELVAFVRGELTLNAAREATVIATRQYAKRQRTWMRSRMADWRRVSLE